MPELPEVETVARDLRPLLLGRRIENVRCGSRRLRFPWRRSWNPKVVGRRIDNVARRGKWLLFQFDDDSFLLGHLGMTGQMRVVFMNDPGETHTHLIFSLDDRMEWRYRDVRRFGGLQRFSSEADIDKALAERLGPEPWALEPDRWFQDLARSRRNLKALLLDQALVAGVGNIYADESLHAAKLCPRKRGFEVSRPEAERLRLAIVRVLDRAIACRGSTIRDYVGGSGLIGGFQHEFAVYGRTGEPCLTCGQAIVCERLAGRSSHYCPKCQPRPARRQNAPR